MSDTKFILDIGDPAIDRLCSLRGIHRGVEYWHLTEAQGRELHSISLVPLAMRTYDGRKVVFQ